MQLKPESHTLKRILNDLSEEERNKVARMRGATVSPRIPAAVKRPTAPVHATSVPTIRPGISHNNPRSICHSVYDFLQKSKLVITSGKDIRLGKRKSYKMNDSGSEKIYYSKNRHSSYLLLTHLACLLDRGSMIYFGPHGTGKTTAPELVSYFLFGIPVNKVQEGAIYGNPELTLTDMVATLNIGALIKSGAEIVKPREFMTSMIRIIDEVNRIPAGKLSVLYQVADRGWTNYKGHKIVAPPGPLFATANGKDTGNYEMPPPFLDRFDIAVNSNYCDASHIGGMFKNKEDKLHSRLEQMANRPPTLSAKDVINIRKEISQIEFSTEALGHLMYFVNSINSCYMASRDPERKTKAFCSNKKPGPLCADCHYNSDKNICSYTKGGLSARTYWSAYTFGKAFSWWIGHNKVTASDLEILMPYLTYHKIEPTNVALDRDPIYVNDEIALVQDMYDISRNQYDTVKAQFPIEDIAAVVNGAFTGNNTRATIQQIDDMMDKIKDIDSSVKYTIGSTLLDIRSELEDGS
jgi:hypothetical protein